MLESRTLLFFLAIFAGLYGGDAVHGAPIPKGGGPPQEQLSLPEGASARLGTARLHAQEDQAVEFSQDGKQILTKRNVYDDAMYSLWEVGTGRKLLQFGDSPANPTSNIVSGTAHAFSPDGSLVAGAFAEDLRIWDTATGKLVRKLGIPTPRGVNYLKFSHDGKMLGAIADLASRKGGEVMNCTLWNVADGKKIVSFEIGETGGPFVFSPTGDSIYYAPSSPKAVVKFAIPTGKPIQGFRDASAVGFSRDGKELLIVARGGGEIQIFNPETAQRKRIVALPKVPFAMVKLSEDGSTLIARTAPPRGVVGQETDVYVIATATGVVLHKRTDESHKIAISSNGKIAASGPALFDPVTGKDLHPNSGCSSGVFALAVSGDGKLVASLHRNKAHVWDLKSAQIVYSFDAHAGIVAPNSIAFSPDNKMLLSSGGSWDLEKKSEIDVRRARMAIAPNGKDLASGRYVVTLPDLAVRLDFGSPLLGPHTSHAYSAKGTRLVTASPSDPTISVRDTAKGEIVFSWPGHEHGVATVAYSPSDRHIASTPRSSFAKGDNSIIIWHAADGKKAHSFSGIRKIGSTMTGGILPLAFSPDGKYLASAFHDHIIRLWDVDSGKEVARFPGHDREVTSIAFTPDGQSLISGSSDATILVWKMPKK